MIGIAAATTTTDNKDHNTNEREENKSEIQRHLTNILKDTYRIKGKRKIIGTYKHTDIHC